MLSCLATLCDLEFLPAHGAFNDIDLCHFLQHILVFDIADHLHLLLGPGIGSETRDSYLVDVFQAHIQVLRDVVVGAAGDESELEVFVVNGHGIGVEGVVVLADQIQPRADLEVFECLAAMWKLSRWTLLAVLFSVFLIMLN